LTFAELRNSVERVATIQHQRIGSSAIEPLALAIYQLKAGFGIFFTIRLLQPHGQLGLGSIMCPSTLATSLAVLQWN
jgi:hypothetical protein